MHRRLSAKLISALQQEQHQPPRVVAWISCSPAHASHLRQSSANCALARSSVATLPEVVTTSGRVHAVDGPEPAQLFRRVTFLVDGSDNKLAGCVPAETQSCG